MTALAVMSLLTTAQTAQSLDLAGHLRALGAPRAAQRLDGAAPPAVGASGAAARSAFASASLRVAICRSASSSLPGPLSRPSKARLAQAMREMNAGATDEQIRDAETDAAAARVVAAPAAPPAAARRPRGGPVTRRTASAR